MIKVCIAMDGDYCRFDLGETAPDVAMAFLKDHFSDDMMFGGLPGLGHTVEWLEASGDDLEFFQDMISGGQMPKIVLGAPRLPKMRWYGDAARTLLWAWAETVLADGLEHDAGAEHDDD